MDLKRTPTDIALAPPLGKQAEFVGFRGSNATRIADGHHARVCHQAINSIIGDQKAFASNELNPHNFQTLVHTSLNDT